MERNILKQAALLAGILSLAATAASGEVASADREQALRYLQNTRSGVADAVKGLSEAQWKFKPAPDRWSVAEIVEHLALVEDILNQNVLVAIEKGPAPSRDPKPIDELILAKVPDRSTKYQAPEPVAPTGRWAPAEALDRFLNSRSATTAWLESASDLRGHVVPHPVFGPLDGYQWIIAVAGHSERHTKQILEVKADPRFPSNPSSGVGGGH